MRSDRVDPDGFRWEVAHNAHPIGGMPVAPLYRAGKVIPNPRPTRDLQANDRQLCSGKVSTMRDLVPQKSQKRRKPKIEPLP